MNKRLRQEKEKEQIELLNKMAQEKTKSTWEK